MEDVVNGMGVVEGGIQLTKFPWK